MINRSSSLWGRVPGRDQFDSNTRNQARQQRSKRRLLLEKLAAREMLAADLGQEPQLAEFSQAESIADRLAALGRTKEGIEARQSVQPVSHDHWLFSWGSDELVEASFGPSVVVSLERAPLIDDAYLVQFQQAFSEQAAIEHLGLKAEPSLAYAMIPRQQSLRAIPNDELFSDQWHLLNDGSIPNTLAGVDLNVTSVWDDYLGTGIVIGVVDDGVQYTHEDLVDQYRADLSFDFFDNDPDPRARPTIDHHGTAVAGVALATQNNIEGGTGVAPAAELSALRLIVGETTDLMESVTLSYRLDEIDIFNNSWGPPDDGTGNSQSQIGPLTMAAIENGVTNGRDGNGAIYVWAGGNGAEAFDHVNLDLYANSRYTIAVGAVGADGVRSPYSETGAPLIVVAPSNNDNIGITTVDISGLEGYSPTDYTNEFGGTSSAAPAVSGVIALMLEANPNLGYRDVQQILARSAVRNDPDDPDWIQNGAGLWVNHNYGFGMVDAAAAVAMAETWVNLPPEVMLETEVIEVDTFVPDDDPTGIEVSFEVRENFQIEYVELRTSTDHVWSGDLIYRLISPTGSESLLTSLSNRQEDFTFEHPLTSARHMGEYTFGRWTLNVSDQLALFDGDLNDVQLVFYGHEVVSPLPLLEVANSSARENNRTMNFIVSIAEPAAEEITFRAATMSESATPVLDYLDLNFTEHRILQGTTSTIVSVPIIDDNVAELDETFILGLTSPSNARVGRLPVQGTIIDDDGPKIIPAEEWELVGPRASMVRRSLDNDFTIENVQDRVSLTFPAAEGMLLSVDARVSNPSATLILELVDENGDNVAGPITAPVAGDPILVNTLPVPSSGLYSLLFRSDVETDVVVDLFAGAVVEQFIDDSGAGLVVDIDPSEIDLGPARVAVIGTFVDRPITMTDRDDIGEFIDISGSGTPLDLGDDETVEIITTIGNKFMPAGSVRVSNNGVLISGSTGTPSHLNRALPNPAFHTMLAPYWDDLASIAGNVFWEEVDNNGVMTLIVQWEGRPHFNLLNSDSSFQVQIIEGNPGVVKFIYRDVDFGSASFNDGKSATIGAQIGQELFFEYSFNTTRVRDEWVVELTAPSDVDFYSFDLTDYVGTEIDVILTGLDGLDMTTGVIEFFDPNGNLVADASPTPAQLLPSEYDVGIANFQVVDPGRYSVRTSAPVTGDYLLLVTKSAVMDTEPNDLPVRPLRKITESTGAFGFLADATDAVPDLVDYYEIELTAGERVIFESITPFDDGVAPLQNTLDPRFAIYHGKGTVLGEDDNSAGNGLNFFHRFIAPEDGNYIVEVANVAGIGEYILQTTRWVNTAPTSVGLVPDTIGENTPTDAAPALVGTLFASDADLIDTHTFDLVSGPSPNDNALFSIVGSQLFVNQGVPLDYETKPTYQIRVRATDDFGDSVVKNLTVFVADRIEVTGIELAGGSSQRSRVESLEVTFDSEVNIAADAFQVNRRGTGGGPVGFTWSALTNGSGQTVATLVFDGAFTEFGSLVDGNYELIIDSSKVTNTIGDELDGDRDGVAGGNLVFGADEADGFFRLFGDFNGDRSNGFLDFTRMRAAFGTAEGDADYLGFFDFNDDGAIGFVDFVQFRGRFGSTLDFE